MKITKYVWDLYTKNYKMPMKEFREDLNKWRDISCSWMGRFNIRCQFFPKCLYRFNRISIKVPAGFFGYC